MATQAKEAKLARSAGLETRSPDLGEVKLRILKSAMRIWKLARRIMTHNPRIVITVKLMDKVKNLFRRKDGLGPCLEDVNIGITSTSSWRALISNTPLKLYSGSGGYKSEHGKGSHNNLLPCTFLFTFLIVKGQSNKIRIA